MLSGHHHAETLSLFFGPGAVTNAGSVDKPKNVTLFSNQTVDSVACGARDRGNHGPIFTDQLIQQCRLARVLATDDRYSNLLEAIAQARDWSVDETRQHIDEGPYRAQGAMDSDLIDGLFFEEEVEDLVILRFGVSTVAVEDYIDSSDDSGPSGTRIAVDGTRGSVSIIDEEPS